MVAVTTKLSVEDYNRVLSAVVRMIFLRSSVVLGSPDKDYKKMSFVYFKQCLQKWSRNSIIFADVNHDIT